MFSSVISDSLLFRRECQPEYCVKSKAFTSSACLFSTGSQRGHFLDAWLVEAAPGTRLCWTTVSDNHINRRLHETHVKVIITDNALATDITGSGHAVIACDLVALGDDIHSDTYRVRNISKIRTPDSLINAG